MNTFFIPPSPNWYLPHILSCAPDNTLVFGSKDDIVIVNPTSENESPRVEILSDEGSNPRVVCVDLTPKWDSPNKWILASWENGSVKIWDMKKSEWKKFTPPSKGEKEKFVGAQFLSEDKILNVFDSGAIIICHLPETKFTHLPNILTGKVSVTCFSPCPHSPHTAAFGLKNGLVVIANLKKNGTVLHKLRGHTAEVVNFSWCPAPVNIFPQKPGNQLKITSNVKNMANIEGKSNKNEDKKKEEINAASIAKPEVNVESPIQKHEDTALEKLVSSENDPKEAVEETLDSPDKYEAAHNSLIEEIKDLIFVVEEKCVVQTDNDLIETVEEKFSNDAKEVLTKSEVIFISRNDESSMSEDIEKDLSQVSENEPSASSEKTLKTVKPPAFEEPRKEYLLASSGKDGAINIWRAGTDGRLQCFFKIQEKKNFFKNKKPSNSCWVPIKWITPFSLLVGTKKGEILKYILPKPLEGKKDYNLVHNEHSTFIFAITAHVPILTDENWFVENEVKIWTFSYDLYLLNTVLDSKITHLSSIETFCSIVNCMAHSLIDPNRIALGLSNGTVKVWNATNASGNLFSTANYSPRIYGKISCLDWHPTNEFIIAFSTEEGTIGLINLNNKMKATWFPQYFASTIYKIQWSSYKGKICLYAIGKGSLVCFNPDNPKEEPQVINMSPDLVPYHFAWKIDRSLMLVSTNCGRILCYDSDLNVVATYYNNRKMNLIVWHPDSERNVSKREFWLAAAVDNVIYVFDFAEMLKKKGTIEDFLKTKIKVHYGNVKSMSWSHWQGDYLVTAAEDGLVHVLNVSDGTILASLCDSKFQPIKAVMWSPAEEDIIIMTMARCANLQTWKLSDYGPLSDDVLKECESNSKKPKKVHSTSQPKDGESSKKAKKAMKSAKTTILPGSIDTIEEKITALRQFLEEGEDSTNESTNIQKLLGTKDDVLSLLTCSENNHISKQKFEAAVTVSAFKGDLQSHLEEAIGQYRVTPLLISLAPSVSMSLWQKACEAYANQICEKLDADPLDVALYFMAGQNIERAIDYLCEKEMHKEALVLAKTRLPQGSIIVDTILLKWANFSAYCGNLETAALCYMKLGKYDEAVKLLFRRNDLNILSIALDLAKKIGNEDMIKAVEFRYNAFSNSDQSETEKSKQILGEGVDDQLEDYESSIEVIDQFEDNMLNPVLTEITNASDKDEEKPHIAQNIEIKKEEKRKDKVFTLYIGLPDVIHQDTKGTCSQHTIEPQYQEEIEDNISIHLNPGFLKNVIEKEETDKHTDQVIDIKKNEEAVQNVNPTFTESTNDIEKGDKETQTD